MILTLEALQILDSIARSGSFAATAQTLNRVPSAITYTIRKLEDDLDVLLFDRSGHRAQLTPAGLRLLEEGRHLLQAAGDLECQVKRIATGWEVELRIALDTMLPFSLLTPLLQAFYTAQQGTRIRILPEVLSGTWNALLDGRADLVIGAPEMSEELATQQVRAQGLHSRLLGRLPFVFVVAPHHPLAKFKQPISAEQRKQYRAVAVGDTARNLPVRTVGLLAGQDVLTVPDMRAKVHAHIAGLGCGFLPLQIAQPLAKLKKLLIKETVEQRDDANLHYVWRCPPGSRQPEGQALRWFLKQLDIPDVRAQLMNLGDHRHWL